MKNLKVLVVSLLLATGALFFIPVSVNAEWVRGYTKKDGTYVNGYWKSNPNGLKYDNYSFDGNWSDAFNDSYYSPKKNYSSDWYTPTWVTQDNYWVGKSFYNSRKSYSTYSNKLYNYNYSYWNDPIYKYTPTYNYGYNYLDSVNTYKSSYFDYGSNDNLSSSNLYSTPYRSYTAPSYSSYSSPYSSSYNSYSTPSYNSYSSPTLYNYSTPSYGSSCYSYYSC